MVRQRARVKNAIPRIIQPWHRDCQKKIDYSFLLRPDCERSSAHHVENPRVGCNHPSSTTLVNVRCIIMCRFHTMVDPGWTLPAASNGLRQDNSKACGRGALRGLLHQESFRA